MEVQEYNIKKDNGKLQYNLLPIEAVEEIIKVLMFGITKYEKNSWQSINHFNDRYYDAAMRHLAQWKKGEKLDSESGLSHLSHAATNCLFLIWKELQNENN